MFLELAKERYSCRKFSEKRIEKDKLEKVIESIMISPTAKNMQPIRVYVLESEESLAKLDELTHCRYGAKTVLLFCYDEKEEWKNPLEEGVHSGVEDVSIAATHAMLMAKEVGLDTCWCNYFANSKLEEAFSLPNNEHSVLIMPIGYADPSSKPAPLHQNKRPVEEVIKKI